MLEFVKGDMFDSPADIRVNTVNCVGVMGAGVALAFKQRYPEMFKEYQRDCKDGRVIPGKMHVWKSLTGTGSSIFRPSATGANHRATKTLPLAWTICAAIWTGSVR